MKRTWNTEYYVAAAVALLTLLVYLPALQNEFVDWDDNVYIFDNPYIRSLDMAFFKWAFWGFHAANWHPLTWASHALDYAVWGLNPLGHHLTSISLHALNTFLVVALVTRLLDAYNTKQNRPALNDRMVLIAAATTGLLFGLHPVHVESVAWVSERKDVLCALFFLLSLLSYLSYVSSNTQKTYLLSLGFFVLALLSKPMAVTLPVVLLILDWYPYGRIRSFKTFWKACVGKLPFLLLSLISSILTLLAQSAGGAVRTTEFAPFPTRLLLAAKALVAYLGRMVWPLNLVPFYPYPQDASLLSPEYLFPLVLTVGITMACVLSMKKHKLWMSIWGFYVVMLIPVIGIVQIGYQSMADRYTYLPSLGPFLALGITVAGAVRKVDAWARTGLFVKITGAAAAFFVVVTLSLATFKQIGVWKNGFDLWTYVIQQEPGVWQAYNMRGLIYANRGEFEKALDDLDKGLVVEPDDVKMLTNHALVCMKVGQIERGLADLKRACDLGSDFGCEAAQYYAKGGR